MSTDTPLTKRLIISGLTPAITLDDLTRRLGSFGTVKAADGFGLSDGLGQPRAFGYVTLETTASKLGKCMNLLSGSTWKGTKLRLGEAKPDYRERIARENQAATDEPPKKRRRRHGGVHAEDMSLVTAENAAKRPGWTVSSLGRTTRPIKMRPTHPLPDVQEESKRTKSSGKLPTKTPDGEKKKKKRPKDPDNRARRKTIDMTKWGSTHLKGIFLDLEVSTSQKPHAVEDVPTKESSSSEISSDSDDTDQPQHIPSNISHRKNSPPAPRLQNTKLSDSSVPTSATTSALSKLPAKSSAPREPLVANDQNDIQFEKAQTLDFLASLFGGKDNEDDEWMGRESVGSDVDVEELVKGDKIVADDDAEFEVVPQERSGEALSKVTLSASEFAHESEGENDDSMPVDQFPHRAEKNLPPATEPSTKTKLKDLFAPQPEEAGFSLLGHLDLDIEFDEDLPFLSEQTSQLQIAEEAQLASFTPPPITFQAHTSQPTLVLDPKQALFFPLPSADKANLNKARQRDVFDLAKEGGWYWRDPAVAFWKTETEDEIRKRWEESKGELTRDWKRRWREAGKVRRRKRGGDGEE